MKVLTVVTAVAAAVILTGSATESAPNPCNPCGHHTFTVHDPQGRNHVTFTSTAPLEDIVGTSRTISGEISFNPNKPSSGGHGHLVVPVASINTGIPLRDEHLRSADWLNAAEYPNIELEIERLKDIREVKASSEFKTYDVTIEGQLSLHGKMRHVVVPGRITYLRESEQTRQALPGDLLAVRATFDVQLKDFDIFGPSNAGLIGSKVGEKITVEASFRASNGIANLAGNPCNPCGGKAMNPCNPCGGKAMNPCNPCSGKH